MFRQWTHTHSERFFAHKRAYESISFYCPPTHNRLQVQNSIPIFDCLTPLQGEKSLRILKRESFFAKTFISDHSIEGTRRNGWKKGKEIIVNI